MLAPCVVTRFLLQRLIGRNNDLHVRSFSSDPSPAAVRLIETRRADGKVQHEHIASLGSVPVEPPIADRLAFWRALLWPFRRGRRSQIPGMIVASGIRGRGKITPTVFGDANARRGIKGPDPSGIGA